MGDTQIGEWLRAKQELKTAEEQLQEIRVRIEQLAKSLEQWRSTRPTATGYRDVDDALKACREAEQKLSQADGALTANDKKLIESIREPNF
jgi:exonuclease VII small subunit